MASVTRCDLFLSYRRGDSGGYARMLFDRLARQFGSERVFFDVETLKRLPGARWQPEINQAIAASKVVLVVIGPDWFQSGKDGKPRINEPDDVLRGEVALALQTGRRVVPVLVGGASKLEAETLPPELQTLPQHQAIGIRPSAFEADWSALVAAIESTPGLFPALGAEYLEKVRDRFRTWSTRFTELQLTFNLRLSTWEGQRYRRRAEEPDESLTAGEAVSRHTRMILIGEPGSGKTTILQRLALEAAEAALRQGDGPIPVFVRLQLWDPRDREPPRRSFLRLIQASLEALDFTSSEEELSAAFRSPANRFLLLCDGLNEVAYEQRPPCARALLEFVDTIENAAATNVLITSRKYNYRDLFGPPFRTLEILELSPEGIRDYLEKSLGEADADAVYADLSLRVRRLIQNPLLLSFAAEIYKDSHEVPRSRGVLIRDFLKLDLRREVREQGGQFKDDEMAHRALARLGLHMETAGLAVPREEAACMMAPALPQAKGAEQLIDELLSARILESTGTRIRFWHQAVQEYFAASEMAERYRSDHHAAIREYASNPKWHEAFAMMTGLLRDDEAAELIRAVERRNVLLAAMCAANANALPEAEDARFVRSLEGRLGRVSLFPNNVLNCAALLVLVVLAALFFGTHGRALSFLSVIAPVFEAPVLAVAFAAHRLGIPFPALAETTLAILLIFLYGQVFERIVKRLSPPVEDRLYQWLLDTAVMPTLSALRYISINSDSARSTIASVGAMAEENPFLPAAVRDYVRAVAGGVEREDELRRMLDDPVNRLHAIRTLGEVGSGAVIDDIKALVNRADESEVVDAALAALPRIASRQEDGVAAVDEVLRRVYDDPSWPISSRRIAWKGLISLGAESLPEPRFTSRDVMRAVRALGQMMRDVLTGSARGSRDRDLGAGASLRRIRNIQEALALMTPARHVVWVFVAIVLFWFSTQGLMINATTVLSSGMAPEILPGDLVAFAQTTYAVRAPARGDVVRYQPQGNGSRWVGRVVGLPGERVRIEAGRVFINGARLIEPNVREPAHDSMAETTIPADQYFILADSRGRSQGDSRRFGPISRPSISQKASMCYWPLRRFHLIRSPAYRFDQDGR